MYTICTRWIAHKSYSVQAINCVQGQAILVENIVYCLTAITIVTVVDNATAIAALYRSMNTIIMHRPWHFHEPNTSINMCTRPNTAPIFAYTRGFHNSITVDNELIWPENDTGSKYLSVSGYGIEGNHVAQPISIEEIHVWQCENNGSEIHANYLMTCAD